MQIIEEIKDFAEKINKEIFNYLSTVKPEILKSASLHLFEGGKRLRPFFLYKIAESYGSSFDKIIPAALSVEFIHTFSLIHDDIMDNDEFRRGKPTVHVVYGIPYAILAGDTLFALAFKVLEKYKKILDKQVLIKIYKELSYAVYKLSLGQGMDMYLPKVNLFKEKLYIETVKNKTAALFEASCVIGALLGGAKYKDIELIRKFATNIGIAFQIRDDVLGIIGDPKITGKPVGNDIIEGKKTLVVIHSYKKSKKEYKDLILRSLGNKNLKNEDLSFLINYFKEIGSIDYAMAKSEEYLKKAYKYLKPLPFKTMKTLYEISNFVIERNY